MRASLAEFVLGSALAVGFGALLSCDDRDAGATSPAARSTAGTSSSSQLPVAQRSADAANTPNDSSATLSRGFNTLAVSYPDSQVVNTSATALYLFQTGTGQAAHFLAGANSAGHFETVWDGTALATLLARNSGTGTTILAEKLANGGNALRAEHFGNGTAAFFYAHGNGAGVNALSTGSATTLVADKLSANGGAAAFSIQSTSNTSPVVSATTNGRGRAGFFQVTNSSSGGEAMRVTSNGPSSTLYVQRLSNGQGNAAVIQSTSFQATGSALLVNSAGTGFAAAINAAGAGGGLRITTVGGAGLQVVGGAKNAVVATSSGARALYTEESAEVWFTDYGFASLTNGRAHVTLDRTFAETVTMERGYHVFVQSYGDAELVVRNRSAKSFDVVRRDGVEDAEFSYRIVAKRKGFERIRLDRAPWADTVLRAIPSR